MMVLHKGSYSSFFLVETGVKQGCLLSGFLFVVITDWLMTKTTTVEGETQVLNGLERGLWRIWTTQMI